MYSEQDKTYIRHYVGWSATFLQAEPRLENAIQSTQSLADGGVRPDSNTENYIKGIIYGTNAQTGAGGVAVTPGPTAQNIPFAMPASLGLLNIDQQLSTLWAVALVTSADKGEQQLDVPRASAMLRGEGRRLCYRLARALGLKSVRADVFSGRSAMNDDTGGDVSPFFNDVYQEF
jgi:hypothetical protein